MTITSPQNLVDSIPDHLWAQFKSRGSLVDQVQPDPFWVEPPGDDYGKAEEECTAKDSSDDGLDTNQNIINGKIYRLGNFVDTDAVSCNLLSALDGIVDIDF